MRLLLLVILCLLLNSIVKAQDSTDLIEETSLHKFVSFLAADSLKGRPVLTVENETATVYIENYFRTIGLIPVTDSGFRHRFIINGSNTGIASNVIGVLPGKSKADEYILISSHFDHLPPNKKIKRDSIFNGANDNASGTAVMMALANYYSKLNNNERSILFCAFNGEELGLLGSEDFASKFDVSKIVAGINLEMLGSPQFGKNKLMMTGMKQSSLGSIIKKNINGTGVTLTREKGADLFSRSDNFSFAYRGVPAHTFLIGNDNEKCYHKTCDDISRMDFSNMKKLANAIVQGLQSIINGTERPTRIKYGS